MSSTIRCLLVPDSVRLRNALSALTYAYLGMAAGFVRLLMGACMYPCFANLLCWLVLKSQSFILVDAFSALLMSMKCHQTGLSHL